MPVSSVTVLQFVWNQVVATTTAVVLSSMIWVVISSRTKCTAVYTAVVPLCIEVIQLYSVQLYKYL